MGFKINRVYTRSGDDGQTALVGGARVSKSDPRVAAYGDIDELNSALGRVKEDISPDCSELHELIEFLQQELFDLGSELATPPDGHYEGMWQVEDRHVSTLEKLCDKFGDGLPELDSFILPGGSPLAASLHLARTIARRAERNIVDVEVSPVVIKYINRLSDLLFILARWSLQKEGKDAPLWVKGDLRRDPLG